MSEQMSEALTDETLEGALSLVERDVDTALRSALSVLRELKRAKKAAAEGQIRDLQKSLAAAKLLASQLAEQSSQARDEWRFDAEAYIGSGRYAAELLRTAVDVGVGVFEEDGRILSYPSVLRTLPSDLSVEIDKKRERRLRPKGLLRRLKENQERPPRFRPEHFLESLARAYDLAVKRSGLLPNAAVRLPEIYEILTLLPGQQRDYSQQEFARDLYLLDQSDASTTKDGRVLSLPASTLTKGGKTFTTVTRSGQRKIYAGISFS